MWLYQGSSVILLLVSSVFGTVCNSNEKEEKKFRVFNEQVNWHAAILNCTSMGMTLATIESQEEQDMITNEIKLNGNNSDEWWIGGSDLHERGKYIWFSTGEPINYTRFADGQPDNWHPNRETEHCMEIVFYKNKDEKYKWNDNFCTYSRPFVCEYYMCSSFIN